MATSYTPALGLAQPAQGELDGTWGDVVNNEITALVEQAIAGITTVVPDSDVELTRLQGAEDQSRSPTILCVGARTAQRDVIIPFRGGYYSVFNLTSGDQPVRVMTRVGAALLESAVVAPGEAVFLVPNDTQYVPLTAFDPGAMRGANNLSEVEDPDAARANIGVDSADVASIRAYSNDKPVSPQGIAAAGAAVEAAIATDYTPNWSNHINLHFTIEDDVTLEFPTNVAVGTYRGWWLVGDSAAARVVQFANGYRNAPVINDLTETYGYMITAYAAAEDEIILSAMGVAR